MGQNVFTVALSILKGLPTFSHQPSLQEGCKGEEG